MSIWFPRRVAAGRDGSPSRPWAWQFCSVEKSSALSRRLRKGVPALLAAAFFPNALDARADSPWAFKDQPFRAAVKLGEAPKLPDAGVAIELPEFGHTPPKNPTVTLTDSKGAIVPVNILSRTDGEVLLLLAKAMEKDEEYFVYFGGAPVHASPTWPARPSLLLETRRLPGGTKLETPKDLEDAWRRAAGQVDGVGFVRTIFNGENPFGESSNFLSKYTGYLRTTDTPELHLFTVSSDASFVFVNGKYEFGWPGKHNTKPNDKNTPNKKIDGLNGLTKIEYYHAKIGGGEPAMGLLWKRGAKTEPIPADQYVHPGTARVERVEGQQGRPAPSPKIKLNSYIGYNGLWLFETSCSVANVDGWKVAWQFEDGATFSGAECTRVIPGLAPVKVGVTLQKGNDRLTGTRLISFHASDIREASVKNEGDVQRYIALLGQETAAQLSARTLKLDITFLSEFAEDPQIAPFAEAFGQQKSDVTDPLWLQCRLTSLRALAQIDPARALAELRKTDTVARRKHAGEFDMLEVDLLVFYLRDPHAVDLARQFAFQNKDANVARVLNTRIGDSYRVLGKYPEAIAQYQLVQKSLSEASGGRKLPAQDRAYSIEINELLTDGYRKEAEQKLVEWESKHPMAKLDSDFLLLRGRLLILLGRWKEALMEIESFEKMQPDSPYQVEGDFYRARAFFELGQKDLAKKMWSEIATKYPKHQFAEPSKQWAKK